MGSLRADARSAERLKRVRQQDIANFIDGLLTDLRKIAPS